jgi:DNA-binding NarL/FixJ family response regulator
MITILMIDDDAGDAEAFRARVSHLFAKKGIDFVTIFGHEMGLWKLARYKPGDEDMLPDVIVQEAAFAGGSSVEIVQFICKSKILCQIPVVIYTGSDDEEIKRACLVAGASQIFPKGPGTQGLEALAAYVAGLVRMG